MFLVLFSVFLFSFHQSHAHFDLSVDAGGQRITVLEDDGPIMLKIHHISRLFERGSDCSGECVVTNTSLLASCNVLVKNKNWYLNVRINQPVKKINAGEWECRFPVKNILITKPDTIALKFLVAVKEVVLPVLPIPHTTLPPLQNVVNFDITKPFEVYNHTLMEGDQKVSMKISHLKKKYDLGPCSGRCEINSTEIAMTSCSVNTTVKQEVFILAELENIKVTKSSYTGHWECFLDLHLSQRPDTHNFLLAINVDKTTKKTELWVFIAIGVSVFVILIIIGQTICILYFKAKAKRAQINKNLTPKNSTDGHDLPDTRYVNKNIGSDEGSRDSGTYEALDTIPERVPIPPPIETIPVTPKPQHHLRPGASKSNLHLRPETDISRTTPRIPKMQESQDTIERSSTLERMKNRPPLALPIADEVYEVMTPGPSPEPRKAASRFGKPKIQEKSPLLIPDKPNKTLFGQRMPMDQLPNRRYVPAPGHKPSMGIPGLPAHKPPVEIPKPSHKPTIGIPGSNVPPGLGRRPMAPAGYPGPGPSGQPPMGHGQPAIPPEVIVAMGGIQILPSMLKPVPNKNIPRAPADEPSRMNAESTLPRVIPPPAHSNIAKPRPVPPFKTKPPIPLPVEPEPLPEEPEFYNGSSDEEFDCYDDLSDYRIYGNAPPKKFN